MSFVSSTTSLANRKVVFLYGLVFATGDPNSTLRMTVLNALICPSDDSPNIDNTNPDDMIGLNAAGSSYVGNMGDNCLACSGGLNDRLGVVILTPAGTGGHLPGRKVTGKIALAHMKEFPDYYVRLEQMEREAERYWAAKPR